MKISYFLGLDAAKHKIRAALSDGAERVLWQSDLAVSATGLRELLAQIKQQLTDERR